MPEIDARMTEDESLIPNLDLLKRAAGEAGRIAGKYFRKNPGVWYKDGKSPVSEADLEVDRFLKTELLTARPSFGWLSEETAQGPGNLQSGRTFIVDPIDGTRAFLKGLSTWCVSIALLDAGRPVIGVLECPERNETYWAAHKQGAWRNGRKIRVAPANGEPTVAGPDSMIDALPSEVRVSMSRHPYIPSLAYRIAMVADGTIDATFVRPSAHDWDIAAADIILGEAGGEIRMADGAPPRYGLSGARQGAMVAGSGDLLNQLHKTFGA